MEEEINRGMVIIDIENSEKSLKNKLDHHSISDSAFEMKKVISSINTQQYIYEIYANDYDPVVISIGPHHHGKHTLQVMEKKK